MTTYYPNLKTLGSPPRPAWVQIIAHHDEGEDTVEVDFLPLDSPYHGMITQMIIQSRRIPFTNQITNSMLELMRKKMLSTEE